MNRAEKSKVLTHEVKGQVFGMYAVERTSITFKKQGNIGEYHINILNLFNLDLKQKRYLDKKKVLSHQDNATVQNCTVDMAKSNELDY